MTAAFEKLTAMCSRCGTEGDCPFLEALYEAAGRSGMIHEIDAAKNELGIENTCFRLSLYVAGWRCVTHHLIEAGQLIGIPVLDHIIISPTAISAFWNTA